MSKRCAQEGCRKWCVASVNQKFCKEHAPAAPAAAAAAGSPRAAGSAPFAFSAAPNSAPSPTRRLGSNMPDRARVTRRASMEPAAPPGEPAATLRGSCLRRNVSAPAEAQVSASATASATAATAAAASATAAASAASATAAAAAVVAAAAPKGAATANGAAANGAAEAVPSPPRGGGSGGGSAGASAATPRLAALEALPVVRPAAEQKETTPHLVLESPTAQQPGQAEDDGDDDDGAFRPPVSPVHLSPKLSPKKRQMGSMVAGILADELLGGSATLASAQTQPAARPAMRRHQSAGERSAAAAAAAAKPAPAALQRQQTAPSKLMLFSVRGGRGAVRRPDARVLGRGSSPTAASDDSGGSSSSDSDSSSGDEAAPAAAAAAAAAVAPRKVSARDMAVAPPDPPADGGDSPWKGMVARRLAEGLAPQKGGKTKRKDARKRARRSILGEKERLLSSGSLVEFSDSDSDDGQPRAFAPAPTRSLVRSLTGGIADALSRREVDELASARAIEEEREKRQKDREMRHRQQEEEAAAAAAAAAAGDAAAVAAVAAAVAAAAARAAESAAAELAARVAAENAVLKAAADALAAERAHAEAKRLADEEAVVAAAAAERKAVEDAEAKRVADEAAARAEVEQKLAAAKAAARARSEALKAKRAAEDAARAAARAAQPSSSSSSSSSSSRVGSMPDLMQPMVVRAGGSSRFGRNASTPAIYGQDRNGGGGGSLDPAVRAMLERLGLMDLAPAFERERLTVPTIALLDDGDLRGMGVPLVDRARRSCARPRRSRRRGAKAAIAAAARRDSSSSCGYPRRPCRKPRGGWRAPRPRRTSHAAAAAPAAAGLTTATTTTATTTPTRRRRSRRRTA